MRAVVKPGGRVEGALAVPGDKSISHRWLLLAATGSGTSRLTGLSRSLDVRSTASCLAALLPRIRPALQGWASGAPVTGERNGSTWNRAEGTLSLDRLELQGEGRASLREPSAALDCGNSGTTMRLLAGLVASSPFRSVLVGDPSLSARPMERVAAPLRQMGAEVVTEDGHPPMTIRGGELRGIGFEPNVPSAQAKASVLLAATAARGTTIVLERIATRDHTERALHALGAPIITGPDGITVEGPFQHAGVRGAVPGDVSSAAFLVGAAALTGGALTVIGVGLNPTRLHHLDVMRRMGIHVEVEVEGEELGEPRGTMRVLPGDRLRPVHVAANELPLVVDEVPVLAALAAHASGASVFEGAAELRVKESDRLAALADGIARLGGEVVAEDDRLTVGGGGLAGGSADGRRDHRIAMALVVSSLVADGPSEIGGIEAADVSFPGFAGVLARLGARVEVRP